MIAKPVIDVMVGGCGKRFMQGLSQRGTRIWDGSWGWPVVEVLGSEVGGGGEVGCGIVEGRVICN
jgi:hypothetical protein